MRKRVTTLLFGFLFIALAVNAFAKDPGTCKTIHYKEGEIHVIRAKMYQGTHIRLPNKLLINPVVGSRLWTVEGDGHHVMIQPNSAEWQGKRTTLTLIDDKNTSYNFQLIRTNKSTDPFDPCVVVTTVNKFFGDKKLSSYNTPEEMYQKNLEQQINILRSNLSEEKQQTEKKIAGILKKYRSLIYTRYQWDNGGSFMGTKLVTDVYDDGRFTYIRVTPDHRGAMAVTAKLDDKQEMIEYVSESDTLYRISGIYPQFDLKYGDSEVSIKRKDKTSNGVY